MAQDDPVGSLLRHARLFREAGAPYMVVGAFAAMVHGHPRATSDIDFVIHLPFAERATIRELLQKAGHEEIEERTDEFGQRLVTEEPSGLQLEIFFTPPRAPYDREFARRVEVTVRGEPVPFLGAEDLILRKLVNTRLRRGVDYDDVVAVLRVQRDTIDLAYLRAHASFYRVGELLERAIADAAAVADERAPPRDAAE